LGSLHRWADRTDLNCGGNLSFDRIYDQRGSGNMVCYQHRATVKGNHKTFLVKKERKRANHASLGAGEEGNPGKEILNTPSFRDVRFKDRPLCRLDLEKKH